MHVNLFSMGHSRPEVKDGLNVHQKRDSRTLKTIDFIFGISLLVLIRDMETIDAVAIFVAAWSALTGTRYFIDQSNRNFYLHRLDWEEAKDDPRYE